MKNLKVIKTKTALMFGFILVSILGCERDLPEDAPLATFPNIAEVFTDAPVNLTDEFFISFDPAGGANVDGFGTDENEAFEGTTSIRIDVPAANDPNGGFIGGIFRDRGAGRNLTQYDALTFYARGSTTGTLGTVGFGTDFLEDKFPVSRNNIQLTTDWKKYVIPIPDASKLVQERGMFLFAAGGIDVLGDGPNGNEIGWTFWLDEIRFETLGTNLPVETQIFNGQDITNQTFSDSTIPITGLSQIVNLGTGENVNVNLAPAYYNFLSSDPEVATISEDGIISVIDEGETTITAALGNLSVTGSMTIQAAAAFVNATDPTLPASSVLSVYSDTYSNLSGLNVGAFNNPSINISTLNTGNNEHIIYENLGFVGIGWDGTQDVSGFTHIHVDAQLLSAGSNFTVELLDFGPDGVDNGFGDGSAGGFNATSQLVLDQWVGLDIPLSSFTNGTGGGGSGLTTFNNMGFVIFVSNNGAVRIDNIYFY